MSKFVIFASARTGSTSLAKVLEESKDVKLALEPFNPDYTKWNPKEKNYSKLIADAKSVNTVLDKIFASFSAIKTLDYQLAESANLTLLGRADLKVLFLTRKNRVEQTISDLVAHQTKSWHKPEDKDIYKKLKPIDLTEMQKKLDYGKNLNSKYIKFLRQNRKGDHLSLVYEKLYSDELEENIKTIRKICKFLDISMPPNAAVEKYMTPSKMKINYRNIYKKIPNYKEIVKNLEQPKS